MEDSFQDKKDTQNNLIDVFFLLLFNYHDGRMKIT